MTGVKTIINYLNKVNEFGGVQDIPQSERIRAKMEKNCKATVIVPVYNEQKNIITCLNQLINQKGLDQLISYEIIIVDNNSTDNSVRIIHRWLTKRKVRNIFLVHEQKQGVACARKRGFDEAVLRYINRGGCGKYYLLSTDADNIIDQYWISKMLECFYVSHSDLIIGMSDYDISSLTKLPTINSFLSFKKKIEHFMRSIYMGRAEGNNFAITLQSYSSIGGIKMLRYMYKDIFYYRASDDWIFSAEILKKNLKIDYCPQARVILNTRKLTQSLSKIIQGNLYLGNWDKHITKGNKIDFDKRILQQVIQRQIRGIIAYHMLLNIYLQPSLLLSKRSMDFLGVHLSSQIKKQLPELRLIYPEYKFNPFSTYYLPSWHLFFLFGEMIFEKLTLLHPELKVYRYRAPIQLNEELKKVSTEWEKNQIIFTFCVYQTQMLAQYFGGWF